MHLEPVIDVLPRCDLRMQLMLEWEKWIAEGLLDEITLKYWGSQSSFIHERVLPLARKAGVAVYPCDRNFSLNTPRGVELAEHQVRDACAPDWTASPMSLAQDGVMGQLIVASGYSLLPIPRLPFPHMTSYAMTTRREQRECFDKNGFVVIPNVLSPSQLTDLRSMVGKAMDGTIKPDRDPTAVDFQIQWEPTVQDNPNLARRDKIRIIFHLCHTHSWFWKLETSATVLDAVENLIGPDIKLYTDQMFCKPAKHGSEVPWHHDSAYWPAAEPNLLSCWLAIDDVTIENGCVRFIPGSHKTYTPHHEIVTTNPNNITCQPGTFDAGKEVPVEIKAGSMSVHHSLCVHRSLPNMSNHSRRGLVMIYLPSDLKFIKPWNFKYGFQLVRGKELATG